MNWFVRRGRALRLPGNKNTMDCETVSVPTPETVTIQLATYGVTGARPLVKKGERISKGAVLA